MKSTLSANEWKLVQASLNVMTIQGKDAPAVTTLLNKVSLNFEKQAIKEGSK
tara:strand:- start:6396 stop:6551 length:156 start_codon:yes stop_codon:yes gene_type:complete